jgi:hypothetical protein
VDRRSSWLVALAGCGRFGFGGTADGGVAALDSAPVDVRPADAAPDAFQIPDLIAEYSMDDDPSDGVIDELIGGHGAHCIPGVSCPTSVAGHRGNALAFDGATQYAVVPYGAWLATPTAYTYAAWVYLDTQSDQVAFARSFGSGTDDSVDMVAWSNGTGLCMESTGAASANESACGPTLPSNQWFHVAGRWDGASKSVFVEGVKVGSLASTVSMMSASDLYLGSDENSGAPAYYWHGKLDEVQIYDRALTDAELATLAAQ